MFIRRTLTRRGPSDSLESYYTYRLVESRREGARVRQVTVLNLGRHFDVPEAQWSVLCARLDQLLGKQDSLLDYDLPHDVEAAAQSLAARLVARAPVERESRAEFAEVDVASLELVEPRSVGVEQVGLHALAQLELEPFLASLGLNAITRSLILCQIVARMAAPASELATWRWLRETSALPELLGMTMPEMALQRLYRSADALVKHQEKIEAYVFGKVRDLFGLEATVTLYDLTNTYFEGTAAANPKARRGHSKEKRTDCPLLTLGLVCDGSGFVRRSRVLVGNAVECRSLEGMLKELDAPAGALVVMDRGIATEANLAWLREGGYRYLVVSRERLRRMPEGDTTVVTAQGQSVKVEKTVDEATGEVRLICHSPLREEKENGICERFCERFEAGLKKLLEGLQKPRAAKSAEVIHERIGRLKAASFGVAQHYRITVRTEAGNVTDIAWERSPVEGSMLSDPGVYVLRSNETTWDAERLWRTYMMLTDLEAVFRSLKSELGLRPVYHRKEARADGHLFITVLAYQCVQIIRRQLKAAGIGESWNTLRATLSVQRRVTAKFRQRDGRTLHVRKSTQPDASLSALYQTLKIDPLPGGTRKFVA